MDRRDFLIAGMTAGALPAVKSAIERLPSIEVVRQLPTDYMRQRTVLLQWQLREHEQFIMSGLRVDYVPRVAVVGTLMRETGGGSGFGYNPQAMSWVTYDTNLGMVFQPDDVIEVSVRRRPS